MSFKPRAPFTFPTPRRPLLCSCVFQKSPCSSAVHKLSTCILVSTNCLYVSLSSLTINIFPNADRIFRECFIPERNTQDELVYGRVSHSHARIVDVGRGDKKISPPSTSLLPDSERYIKWFHSLDRRFRSAHPVVQFIHNFQRKGEPNLPLLASLSLSFLLVSSAPGMQRAMISCLFSLGHRIPRQ
ncbi:hypothetical protein AVEN_157256-1 [Araneus ventricosus]|uniref:Uncharacterized protein n=1 Tax=Araneus ventricosus TaxID=182803 RepID=A0A4Y2VNI4_ARAVE|nr:hypothetical protein AVEN_32200-1 [Araneus ventricosus]GBO25756.1 hypothetical protein AVEN_157256-1 [Araneus ventricosus]